MKPLLRSCLILLSLLLFSGGCKTARKPDHSSGYPFFPPDREHARLQYLTSFSSPADFEAPPSKMLSFVVGELPVKRPMVKPYGLALKNNELLVCDTVLGLVHRLDLAKREWSYFRPDGPGTLKKAVNLDIDDQGRRYVADTVRGQVVVFDSDGRFVGTIGQEFELKPSDVKVVGDRIYVADLKSHRIRLYNRNTREFLFAVPTEVENEDAALFGPTNVAVGPRGDIYASDSTSFRVQRYAADGSYKQTIGQHGDTPGSFARNKGVAVDAEGRVYVVDAAFQNVQIFDDAGKLLLHFGDYSKPDEGAMVLPAGVVVDAAHNDWFRPFVDPGFNLDYVVLVVNQYGTHKITAYGFVHKK
jgi:sugar lactone lactonase YvrE